MTLFKGVIQRITDSSGATGVTSAAVLTDNAIVQGAGGARGVDSNATGNRVTKGWFTDIETTNAPSVNGVAASGTGAIALVNGPTFVAPLLGTPASGVATNLTGTASGLIAGTVTTNANLTGAITSVGNAASLGSFSSANLATALSDETGTGSAVFGTSPTLTAPLLASGVLDSPQGRLTLTTATPVQTANATAQATVYYTQYRGTHIPIYNGTNFVMTAFAELSLALDSNSGHTGYQQSGKNFDLFVVNDSGTIRLGTGPAWTNDTSRANAVSLVNGIWVNTAGSLTFRFGSASGNTLTIGASQATYVGTMRATADGQTGMNFNPAAASGGTNNILGLYNAYNKVFTTAQSQDSAANYSYTSGTIRAANASNSNRISAILGLSDTMINATYTDWVNGGSGAVGIYIGIDSTTTQTGPGAVFGAAVNASISTTVSAVPGLGFHFVQALESGATAATFGTSTFQGLTTSLMM